MPISEPVNPIAAHIGGGIVQVYVEFPVTGILRYFEVRVGSSLSGPYQYFGNRRFKHKDGWIYGFTPTTVIYMQIRAVATDGSTSDWVQVKKAVLNKVRVIMQVRALQGSVLEENAVLVTPKVENRLLAFRVEERVEFI